MDYFEDFDVVCEGAEEEGADATEFEHEALQDDADGAVEVPDDGEGEGLVGD